ncbi:sugar ABC transporter permease [Paenibacillus sp. MZ04-78.2]|uniref:carbohydrate ABC transporter permease n=1 Tax=Paenibacillus sp. MZ04-78.2 TaxID=2962034 RepID=UPI0020B68932|nr:sugar ABC transporter permease [Paenibacillus sp. MZ04-78.2]MCP3775767.1 sugar ABC transporter permease [Paenibacillus sp. MZ04-78.2]
MDNLQRKTYSFSFAIPWLLIYAVFFILPTLFSFYYAFTDWDIHTVKYAGVRNFVELFENPAFSMALKNTALFTITTIILKTGCSLLLAVALYHAAVTRNFFRTVFFSPYVMSYIAIGVLFTAILHPEIGILNRTLRAAGLDFMAMNWLVDKSLVIFSLSFIDVWRSIGFHLAIFIAAMQTIPSDLMESASVDGAGPWKKFWHITFPMLAPAFNANIIFALIVGLTKFDLIYATTGGGPGYYSEVLRTMVYKQFSMGRYGLATAGELVIFVVVIILTVFLRKSLEKREVEM